MRIAVTGGAGAIGSRVTAGLAARGADTIALVRDVDRVRAAGVRAARVEYEEPASLAAGLAGVDRLVFIGSDGEADRMLVHHRTILDAAAAAGVERIVLLGSQDADPSSPFCYAHTYAVTEAWLRDACPQPVVVRSGLYAEFFGRWVLEAAHSGVLSLPMPTGAVAPIARADVADALVAVVTAAEAADTVLVTGPRAYDHDQLAGVASGLAAFGVRSSPCSAGQFARRLLDEQLSPWWRYAFQTLFAGIAQGRFAAATHATAGLIGRPAQHFPDVLRAIRER